MTSFDLGLEERDLESEMFAVASCMKALIPLDDVTRVRIIAYMARWAKDNLAENEKSLTFNGELRI